MLKVLPISLKPEWLGSTKVLVVAMPPGSVQNRVDLVSMVRLTVTDNLPRSE
jgi:hypothetical protein